jgi:hypothetical protein
VVKTYSLLCQLSRALVLGVSEQLDNAALIGSKAGDLTNNVADERCALAELTLLAGDADGCCDGSDLLWGC